MKYLTRRVNEWLTVVIAFIFFYLAIMLLNLSDFYTPLVTNVLFKLSTLDALNQFNGKPTEIITIDKTTISVLVSLILNLMIAPFLLYKGYKASNNKAEFAKPWYWYLGWVMCIWSLSIVPLQLFTMRIHSVTVESVGESRAEDLLRAELMEVGFATADYEILESGLNDSFSIEDLGLQNLEFDYTVVHVASDTLVTIKGSIPEQSCNSVSVDVRPYSKKILNYYSEC